MSLGLCGRSLTVGALILPLLLTSCGVPGEPQPPLLELPAPIQDLSVEQVGAMLRMRWTTPALTTEGTGVRELERLELYSETLSADGSLTDFAAQATLKETFTGATGDSVGRERPLPIFQSEKEFSLSANQIGSKAYFGLKAINRRGKDAGFSNIASVEIIDLPEPPTALTATLTEPAIELRWKPAEHSVFGGPAPTPDGYEVYRAEADSKVPPQMLGTATTPSYDDKTFVFGAKYVYFVHAFARRGDSTARTPESNHVELAAVDRFPPAAPQNLRAIAVPGAVELAWSANEEADLAGYNVYRAEGGASTRLNSELLTLPLYRDATARAGTEYRYVVKAVDLSGNEGPPSAESSVAAE
jgi:hypothetical protein